jgi:MFS family permease
MVYTVFGLFLIPITDEFGWSRSKVSFALFFIAIANAVLFPVIGRLIDRHGARKIILSGNLFFAASVASVALIDASVFQFYLAFLLIGMASAVHATVMYTKVIASWFDDNRALFLGISGGLGNGIGAVVAPIFAAMLIANYGWRGGYLGIGAAVVLIGFPVLLLLLHDPPGAGSQNPTVAPAPEKGLTLTQARKTEAFWIILVAIALVSGVMTAIFAHVVPMLLDRGIPMNQALAVISTFSMVTALWQVGLGFILDRFPRPWIAVPFYLAAVVGLILVESATSYPGLLFAALLLGMGLGTEFGTLPYFISRYFGVRHYGAISGTVYSVIVITQGLAPVLMALTFDFTGSYDLAMIAIGGSLLAGVALILRLPPFGEFMAE